MENVRTIAIIVLISVAIIGFPKVFSYEAHSTHPGLTSEILKFYEHYYPETFSENEKQTIIQASIAEDEDYRYFYHFYDPVNNEGLTLVNQFATSKNWANNVDLQAKHLDFTEKFNRNYRKHFEGDEDYSWDRSIYEYVYGDKNRALAGLGHVLHLIEDLTVPDHTRNDPHPNIHHEKIGDDIIGQGSYYEMYSNRFNTETIDVAKNLIEKREKIVQGNSLDFYFDKLATFSNNNFFSRSTLPDVSEYNLPDVHSMREKKEGDKTYYYNDFNIPILAYQEFYDADSGHFLRDYLLDVGGDKIMSSYWNILSKEAIKNGAGVIDLFFREVEIERETGELLTKNTIPIVEASKDFASASSAVAIDTYNYVEKKVVTAYNYTADKVVKTYNFTKDKSKKTYSIIKNSFSKMSSSISNWFKDDNEASIARVFVEDNPDTNPENSSLNLPESDSGNDSREITNDGSEKPDENDNIQKISNLLEQIRIAQKAVRELEKEIQNRQNNVPQNSNNPEPVNNNPVQSIGGVGGFVMVAGSSPEPEQSDPIDENPTENDPIDSNNPEEPQDPDPEIPEEPIATTTPKAEINSISIAECDDSISDQVCLLFPTTELNLFLNIGEGDFESINISWAGNSTTTASTTTTMSLDFSDELGENTIKVNLIYDDDSSGDIAETKIYISEMPVVINEIAWMGTEDNWRDEWIELYNNTPYNIFLDNFSIITTVATTTDTATKIPLSGQVKAKDYYLLERANSDVTDVKEDLVYGDGGAEYSLSNEGEQLNLYYGDILVDSTPVVSDDWVTGDNDDKCSMERYNPLLSGVSAGNWFTAYPYFGNGYDAGGNSVCGSPRQRNSSSYLINNGNPIETTITVGRDFSPYIIHGQLPILEGGKLIIDAGVIIKFYDENSGMYVMGQMEASGKETEKVIFTSLADGGFENNYGNIDINKDNSAGYIYAISPNAKVDFQNAVIRSLSDTLVISGASVNINGLEVENTTNSSETIGVYGGKFNAENLRYKNNGNTNSFLLSAGNSELNINNYSTRGFVSGNELFSFFENTVADISNIDIDSIDTYLLANYANASTTIKNISILDSGNVELIGAYHSSKMSLENIDIENLNGGLLFAYNDTVVKVKNVDIENVNEKEAFSIYHNSNFNIENVVAGFVSEDGLVIVYGNSNVVLDKLSITEGDQYGIQIFGNSLSEPNVKLSNSTFSNIADTAIYSQHANTTIENIVVTENLIGIYALGGQIGINKSIIKNNILAGLWNSKDMANVTATNNNWGDITGPYHENDNPSGLGDFIIGQATFDPWVGKGSAPLLEEF